MASNKLEVLDPASTAGKLKKIVSGVELNRRHFMTALGAAGVAVGTGLVSTPVARAQQQLQNGFNQNDVLNYLLNIKFLTATLYSYIATGADLPATYATPQPTLGTGQIYSRPGKVTFSGPNASQLTDMFNELYYDELNHVVDLQAVLGTAALPRTTINMAGNSAPSNSISAQKFSAPPATETLSETQAISLAQYLEDLSVTAFANALPYLTGAGLALASQILAADGIHAGSVRLACIQTQAPYNYSGTQNVTYIAGGVAGSTTLYALLNLADPPQVGYTISASLSILPPNPNNPAVPSTDYGQLGFAGFATITAIPGPIPTSYLTASNIGAHHSYIVTGADTTGLQPGMPVVDGGTNGRTIGTGGSYITAIITPSSGPGKLDGSYAISAGTGSSGGGHISIGITALTISTPLLHTGVYTITSIGFLQADPNAVAPADIGAGVATTGPEPIGTNPVPKGFFATAGSGNTTPASPAGLAHARTFSQVLAILYASSTPTTYSGGFFPIGVSGSINVV